MAILLCFLLPLCLALFPFKLSAFSFFFLVPLLDIVLNKETSFKKTLLLSFLVGLVYYGVAFFWISESLFKLYAINLLLALWIFPFFFCALYLMHQVMTTWQTLCSGLILWWLTHTLMTLTPVNAIAMDYPFLTSPLSVLQIAEFTGFVGWQMILMGFQVSLVIWLRAKESERRLQPLMFFTGLMVLALFYGNHKIHAASPTTGKAVALVQHDMPMSTDWRVENQELIKFSYQELAKKAKQESPELIVFPLYTMVDDHFRDPSFFAELAKSVNTPILMATHVPIVEGADTFGADYENYAVFFSKKGEVIAKYQAVQKAPEFVRSKEATADKYVVMETPLGKIGILLCFEDTVPRYARAAQKQGAEILITLSNPGHFVNTKMPRLYKVYDRLRAIETRLPLLRLSPNGPTVIMNRHGRILKKAELNQTEIIHSV